MKKLQHYLDRVTPDRILARGIGCVALCHNEIRLLPQFIDHYRSLGVKSFAIVDDHSTDGSFEWLARQPDVTLFRPVAGSTYAKDKRYWRAVLLDSFFSGRWVFVPDIDEHFIYPGYENDRPGGLLEKLDSFSCDAVFSIMIDMYRDAPISNHVHDGTAPLRKFFPLFDRNTGTNYWMLLAPRRFRMRYPTPQLFVSGGMRERFFFHALHSRSAQQRAALARWGTLDQPLNLGAGDRIKHRFLRSILRNRDFYGSTLNLTKISLLRWRQGAFFYGGAHAVSAEMTLCPYPAVLLHYKFTSGLKGLEYVARRGQHMDGARYYRKMLQQKEILDRSPVFEGTSEFSRSDLLFSEMGLPTHWA